MGRVLRGIPLITFMLSGTALGADLGTADLLIIPSMVSPAELAMGSTGRALAAGPLSLFCNPAAMRTGFAAAGGRWNLGTTAVSASGVFSVGDGISTGAGLRYLGRGNLVGRDESGQSTGEFSWSSGMASGAVSMKLAEGTYAGLSAGAAWEKVDADAGTGFSCALGAWSSPIESLEIGAVVDGLGSTPSWNGAHKDMPTSISGGLEYSPVQYMTVFSGGRWSPTTASSGSLGARGFFGGMTASAGYELSDETEVGGVFCGLGYLYQAEETYIIEIATSQRDVLDWPVLAGLSVYF